MPSDDFYTWDEVKREATLRERGLDFAAMSAFDWDDALTVQDDRRDYPEVRYVSIGALQGELVVCVWCYRDGGTRIISLRKANNRERKRYDKAMQAND
ncbi:MAG: hypothetical protein A2516_01475 [Alphaproteobacteria bacterium RIFOXYD12_FULL_60_8]|nr:MAG: hypothetical protein A2516_01475 [Alphaproteobacteria bacterium RIFOXYD12_FULL_60_8]